MRLQRSHVVLIVLWFTWFWSISCPQMIAALMPAIQEVLSLSTGATGFLLGVYGLGLTIASLGSSYLYIWLEHRKVIALSTAVVSLCMLFISLTANYLSLLILELLIGLGTGIYLPAALSILSDLFPHEGRGRYIGIHEAAVPAGMTFGPIFASLMLSLGLNWAGCLQFWVFPAIIILISQFVFVRKEDDRSSLEKKWSNGTETELISKYNSWPPKCLLLLLIVQFLHNVAAAEISLMPTYWVNYLKIEVGIAAFVYGITRVFSIFGQFGAGYLSDIFGRLRVLLLIQVLSSLLLVFSSYLPFGISLFVSFAALSSLINGYMPVMFALVSDTTLSIERTKMMGLVMACGGLSTTISPIILGLLAEYFSFQVAWIYPIVASFLSIFLLILLKIRLREQIQDK